MNPFELTGFGFLAFYTLLGATLLGLMVWLQRSISTAGYKPRPKMADDPYKIAYLRAGANEAVKVATISLIDRGLLVLDNDFLAAKDKTSTTMVQRRIERELLMFYSVPKKIERAVNARLAAVCDDYRKELLQYGLLPDASERLQNWLVAAAVIICLVATTVIKVNIALSQGRHNLGFLILLTILFSFLTLKFSVKHASPRGMAVLADLRTLFARLKARAHLIRAGGETNEATLLAAVFGLQMLPLYNFPFIKTLYPPNDRTGCGSGGDGGSGCGSSCGGGCGGGGCGG
ncbi:MAG TPA: TIGR04222 domain-containing membrane protein [Burkholderiaceae bacterium]|jgi:uncharacterized protein (TIGR04222 family)